MTVFFEQLIDKLNKNEDISKLMLPIEVQVRNKEINLSKLISDYISFLRNKSKESDVWQVIDGYLKGNLTLIAMSRELFLDKVKIDEEKRKGHGGLVIHNRDDSFLAEIFRVIHHFTRDDVKCPKGVCFDFCLFIAGMFWAVPDNPDKKRIFMWHSIEKESSENNFVILIVDDNGIGVYDPFNKTYIAADRYDKADVGFKLIELNLETILQPSLPLTGFCDELSYLKQIIASFFDKDAIESYLKEQNFYERLGVQYNATPEEIKRAFRNKSRQYHSDRNPTLIYANERFALIDEAYEILSDNTKRAKYDKQLGLKTSPITAPVSPTNVQEPITPHQETPLTDDVIDDFVIRLCHMLNISIDFYEVIKELIYDIINKLNIESLDDLETRILSKIYSYLQTENRNTQPNDSQCDEGIVFINDDSKIHNTLNHPQNYDLILMITKKLLYNSQKDNYTGPGEHRKKHTFN